MQRQIKTKTNNRNWLSQGFHLLRDRKAFPYLMLAPTFIAFLILTVFPILKALQMSLFEYTLIFPTHPFIALDNFKELFNDELFWSTMLNTVLYTVVDGTLSTITAILLALALKRKFKGIAIIRTIILIPWIAPTVVVGYIFVWLFNGPYSPINELLMQLHLIKEPFQFLGDLNIIKWGPITLPWLTVNNARLWISFSYKAIIFLAAIQAIPENLYEAAVIDGASKWQRFKIITWPFLVPVLSIVFTLTLIHHFGHFDLNYFMTEGGPQNATNVMAVLVYLKAFEEFRLGYASAMGIIMLFLTGSIAYLYIHFIVNREEDIM